MTRRPRILLVSPTYTHPANQGNSARIQAMGLHLKRAGIDVDVLFYVMEWAGDESISQMRSCWNAVHLLGAKPNKPQSFATCWGLDDWCPDELVDEVARLQSANGYDAVIVNYVWLSKALTAAGSALKILDTHDLFGDRHNLARRAGVEPNWYFTSIAEESRGFDRADIVIAIQKDEMAMIATRTMAEPMLVSHPMLPRTNEIVRERRPVATFGYIGSANPWNQLSVMQMDAAFAGRGIDWCLAGRICRVPQPFNSDPFIMGEIDDVEDFYSSVECSLNPMVEATGLKIKTIEALAHDIPVIGTPGAFAGLDAVHPFHLCPDPEAVAVAAAEFAASQTARTEVHSAGRRLFFDYLAGVEAQYDTLTSRILDRKNPSRVTAA